MSGLAHVLTRHPVLRWAAPAVAVAVIAVVGVTAADAASADDHPVLPAISAQDLLAEAMQPTTASLSGTVAVTADLGLPDLSGLTGMVTGNGIVPGAAASLAAGSSSSDTTSAVLNTMLGLLTGNTTLRVWSDGPSLSRVAILANGTETDLIHHGTDLWLWQSAKQETAHPPTPATSAAEASGTKDNLLAKNPGLASQLPTTPQQAAAMMLAAAGPSTDVTTESTASVAGRPAYQLVATPKDSGSLVARVVVAIDAQTHVPLRTDVYSTELTTPAFSVGFTDVSFTAPAAGTFAFTPPAGATVQQLQLPTTSSDTADATAAKPDVQMSGTGWASVVVVRMSDQSATGAAPGSGLAGSGLTGQLGVLLKALPTASGDWGTGHVLAGTLFSVLIADNGTLAAGAVPAATLKAAVAGTHQ